MYRIYIWLFTNSPQDTPKLSSLSLFCNQPSWSTKSDISSLSRQKGQSQKLTFSHFCYDLFNFLPLLFFVLFFVLFCDVTQIKKIEKKLKPTAILSWNGHPWAPTRAALPMQDLEVVDLCIQPSLINWPVCLNLY